MSHERFEISPAPADTLNIVDHQLHLLGQLVHDPERKRSETGLIMIATESELQEVLDRLKFALLSEILTVRRCVNSRNENIVSSIMYAIPVDVSHPGYLWAVMENLHKYRVEGKEVVGMFPQKGERELDHYFIEQPPEN